MDADELIAAHKNIIKGLLSLPETLDVPVSRGDMTKEIHLHEDVRSDVRALKEFWNYIQEHMETQVVGLVGMVNAGKSAVGNLLMNGDESQYFEEGPVRQTDRVSQCRWAEKRILVDLPGLGSVLASEDDEAVRKFIKRANLLLIIISVDAPISRHLYEFFQSDLLKSHREQRIVIVLNKIDMWDGIPQSHRQKELDRYTGFLTLGDKSMGFPGVARLFDYEVPVIPFSVIRARLAKEKAPLENLVDAIQESLQECSGGYVLRAAREMLCIVNKYDHLRKAYDICIGHVEAARKKAKKAHRELRELQKSEAGRFVRIFMEIDQACWNEMQSLPAPGFFEKMFETDGLDRKKTVLRETHDKYNKRLRAAFSAFAGNLVDSAEKLLKLHTNAKVEKEKPSPKEVYHALEALNYVNWDVHDDMFFRGTDVSQQAITERTRRKREEVLESLKEWLEALDLDGTCKRAANKGLRRQKASIEALKEFVKYFSRAEDVLSTFTNNN